MGRKASVAYLDEDLYKEAEKALEKPSTYGPDIDVSKYFAEERMEGGRKPIALRALGGSTKLGEEIIDRSSYLQVDGVIRLKTLEALAEKYGVIVSSSGEALEKYPWARKLFWRLLSPSTDKYTALALLKWRGEGYFIYIPPGVKVEQPIYACLLIARQGYPQIVHNVIVVGDGAEAHIVTGCATARWVSEALHIGVTEIYVGRRAKLSFAMIHSWGSGVHVRPRSAIALSEDSTYINYYATFSDVASLQTYPRAILEAGSKLISVSVVLAPKLSHYDVGFEAVLKGAGSSAQIISRIVASGSAKVYSRTRIRALEASKGYSECSGLQLSPSSIIHAVPELVSETPEADLGHEASIGKISEEELVYLMSRGLNEEEAIRLILHGFMYIDVPGLPETIKKAINATTKIMAEKARL